MGDGANVRRDETRYGINQSFITFYPYSAVTLMMMMMMMLCQYLTGKRPFEPRGRCLVPLHQCCGIWGSHIRICPSHLALGQRRPGEEGKGWTGACINCGLSRHNAVCIYVHVHIILFIKLVLHRRDGGLYFPITGIYKSPTTRSLFCLVCMLHVE